ncbi:hypothetical protein GGE66_002531 [Rhizobium leguminosarum]|uniref:Uncharacterized protein n=1 Tax=Rhizobium leguminosarum TaxID=384 RepID=A0A7W9ZSV0_RHILE|nr:hypothetical protein [Rhizobium leguminosarum]
MQPHERRRARQAKEGVGISAGIQESLTLRCPGGASKGGAGALVVDECKKQRCGVSFEASPCGLRTSG